MLNKIIGFSVRNKLIVGLCTLALIIAGVVNLSALSIDALPDITSNQVQVITLSPSLASPEVERLVTFPVEQANANIPGITEMRSISRFGLSVVTIVFNDGTDIYWARQQVAERLNQVKDQIPSNAGRPEMAPVTTGLGEVYQYVVRPAPGYEGKYNLAELRSIQDWIIRRQLLGTPGVADVSSFGGWLKQYEVAVIPEKLKSLGVTLGELFTALENNNQNAGGAYIEKGPNVLYIRTEGLAATVADIERIPVKTTPGGMPVLVRDLAKVQTGHAIRYGAMTYSDQGEVAGAVVLMLKGANASKVVKDVKARIDHIRKTLPEGVILEPFYDRTKMVNNAIGTVKKNLMEGALIVIFILVLFLGNLRAGLIVASVIPLAMLFAIIMMNIFGVSGNLMSLGALDFGLIVDGAVIIVEAVMHRLYHSRHFAMVNQVSQQQMDEEVEHAAGKMMSAAVFGQIIILIVYLPILSLVGIEGKMFKPMAQTVSFALIGAFLLSLTYVPMITSLMLSRNMTHKENWADKMMRWLESWYQPTLGFAIRYAKSIMVAAVLLFAFSVVLLSRLGGEFIPELEEGDFAVDARILTGSSLTESIRTTQQAVKVLNQFPEVEKIVTRIGASEIPTDPMPVEMSDIIISLKPKEVWTSARNSDELATKMSAALQEIPGITAGFQFPVQMRFNELISGARQDVVCKIFGEDLDTLARYAKQLGTIISGVNGATDLYVETVTGLPQIVIHYNREAMARFQVSVSEINRTVRAAFAGESAGLIYENERRYDLVVRLEDRLRHNMNDVQNLLISTRSGLQVPLYQLADVSIQLGPNQIQRENARRRIIVGFNVRGRDVQSLVQELDQKVNQQLHLPAGYVVSYGGQFENLVKAKQRLTIAVPAALLLIFVMLYFAFGKLKYGLLIFSAIPLSAIGGVLALWIRDMPFSISAGVGFIALFGVAVLNGIVLIAEFNRLKKEGVTDIRYIVMEGTKVRLRPVLMTAAVASLGFLPMALSHGPGAEVQRPLATVVIGGLLTATLLTLLVLPLLYIWFEKAKPIRRRRNMPTAGMLLLLLAGAAVAQGQTETPVKMSLKAMLDQSSQNLMLQSLEPDKAYWKTLAGRVFEAPKTELGMEYGNINSVHNDTRFYINQRFLLPTVYKSRKNVYEQQAVGSEAMIRWKQREIRKEVKLAFYEMVDLEERRKLLLRLDSLYSRFEEAARLRYRTGEGKLLEQTAAFNQLQQLKLQQEQLQTDMYSWQQQLQWLLHSNQPLMPDYTNPLMEESWQMDSTLLQAHPYLQWMLQKKQVAAAQTRVEQSTLAPELGIGYNNMSIIGWQTKDGVNEQYYKASDRFHIYNFMIGIPLFAGATKARINAARINENKLQLEADAAAAQLQTQFGQALLQYQQQKSRLTYFQKEGLKQSELLISQARLGYQSGESSFAEWMLLMNEAVSIQLQYLESVRQLNKTNIELEYLTEK